MTSARRLANVLAFIAILFGIVTIAAGELSGAGWTRLVSGTLVGTGGLILGLTRAADFRGVEHLWQLLAAYRMAAAVTLTLMLLLPALAALVAVPLGFVLLFLKDTVSVLSLLGVATAVIMLGTTGAAAIATLRAMRVALSNDGSERRGASSGSRRS